jgi:DNA-binding response OmpR family regulator
MTKRITLVKAQPAPRDATCAALQEAGFDVDAHGEGESALEAMRATPPAALVTDCVLSGIAGAELAARARALCPGGRLFVVALAERGDAAPPSAFDEVLLEPVDIAQLVALLRR